MEFGKPITFRFLLFLNKTQITRKTDPDAFRQARRIGNFKAVRYDINSPIELYDLDNDISETTNIAIQHPEINKKVEQIFVEEREENIHFPYGGRKHDIKE